MLPSSVHFPRFLSSQLCHFVLGTVPCLSTETLCPRTMSSLSTETTPEHSRVPIYPVPFYDASPSTVCPFLSTEM